MRTFKLDEVEQAREPAPTRSLGTAVGDVLCLGADAATPVIEVHGAHPLIGAVHAAFAEHRPLCLSPDAVWLTIAQGVAQHVRMNAETLRSRLVRHRGREIIEVRHTRGMPRDDTGAWNDIIDGFRDSIAARMGQGIARLFTCDFTTTTLVERVASEIVLMDAVSPYFDFYVVCVCGIPEITLSGTPADWRRIRERVDIVAELGMDVWAQSLAPIADHFVLASDGKVDLAHWKRIYKPRDAYGSETITGWIARLYPYVKHRGRLTEPNPLLALPMDEPRDTGQTDGWYNGPGIKLEDAPGGLSSVRVRVVDHVSRTRTEVAFEGGLLGVAFDGRALSPIAGFAIREHAKGMLDLIDEIERAHRTERATPCASEFGMADMRLMYNRIGSATLFPGEREWRIRPYREWERVELPLPYGRTESVSRFIDLPNQRCIAIGTDREGAGAPYVLCDAGRIVPPAQSTDAYADPVTGLPCDPKDERAEKVPSSSTQPIEDIPVVATSLAALLEFALKSKGDDQMPAIGRLVDRLPQWMKEPPPRPRSPRRRSERE
jgi:hypothetical protein